MNGLTYRSFDGRDPERSVLHGVALHGGLLMVLGFVQFEQ